MLGRCIGISSVATNCDEKGDPNDDANDTNICLVTMLVMLAARGRNTDTFLYTLFLFVLSCNVTFLPKVTIPILVRLNICKDDRNSVVENGVWVSITSRFVYFVPYRRLRVLTAHACARSIIIPLTQLIYFQTARQGYVIRQLLFLF